jgi:MAF protein
LWNVSTTDPSPVPVILASASPRRRAAIRYLGLAPGLATAAIEEIIRPGERPVDAAVRLATGKAAAIAAAHPEGWIIGADTLVIGPDGDPLGKPATAADARSMLLQLRGRPHQVVTAQAVIRADRIATDHLSTLVLMRPYGEDEIGHYIATGDPFDKAGSYAIQNPEFRPVRSISGCYLNVVGLPICRTARLLRECGFPGSLPDLRPPWCQVCRRAAAGELEGL